MSDLPVAATADAADPAGATDRADAADRADAVPGTDAVHAVLDVLDLREVDTDTFRGLSLPKPGGRVFGGQVLAQSLLAAARTVEPDRMPHSVHGYFLRPGAIDRPIFFAIERLRDGRSFTARRTHAIQDDVPILSMITSFQPEQPGDDHADAAPDAPPPGHVRSAIEALAPIDHPVATFWSQDSAFDVRHVGESLYLGPGAERTDRQMVWIKARGPLPDDEVLHRALLAYACDQVLLEPVLRRHGHSWATPGLSIASLDHAMWWHRPVRVDQWLLYVQASPSAHGGRGLGTAEVFSQNGTLVATIAQEGMVRVPS
ncbi:MAG: acyl-CoA thioesterase II [Cellulomonadaceae bacterium]|nr:acyl-CoA thioesterase II [Cellulomonadaceae bacterium]